MKFDTFTFNRPTFYKKKAAYLYKIKRNLYALRNQDLDSDWSTFILKREALFDRFCKDKKVLDIGCGTGDLMGELDEKHGASDLFGIDVSEAMVEKALKTHPDYGFSVASSTNLPFEDNEFDVVTFQWVFHHLPAKESIDSLKEAKRVSKETIIVQDTLNHETNPMRQLSELYWRFADGGVLYRDRSEWHSFFYNHGLQIKSEHHGDVMRTCLYVLGADN